MLHALLRKSEARPPTQKQGKCHLPFLGGWSRRALPILRATKIR